MTHAGQIVAVLLASGLSSRFGSDDKLLAELHGQALVLHAADRVIELRPLRRIAVCGTSVGELLKPLGFEIVLNEQAEQGMSTSLAYGIETAEAGEGEAALVVLGDMPFVTVQHLRHLLARWDAEETPVIGSVTKGVAMPPALFARSRFAALRANTGDHGARGLLATAKLIEAPPEQLADVDTIDDLLRLRALR